MARETGIYRRAIPVAGGLQQRYRTASAYAKAAGTEDRREAEALLAKLKVEAYQRSELRHEARALVAGGRGPVSLRQAASCGASRTFGASVAASTLTWERCSCARSTGDVIWQITQDELKRGNQAGDGESLSRHHSQPVAHRTRRVAVDRSDSEDPPVVRRERTRSLVDPERSGSLDRGRSAALARR